MHSGRTCSLLQAAELGLLLCLLITTHRITGVKFSGVRGICQLFAFSFVYNIPLYFICITVQGKTAGASEEVWRVPSPCHRDVGAGLTAFAGEPDV